MNSVLKEFLLTFLTALATGLSAVLIRLITAKINYIVAKTEDEKKQRFLKWIEDDIIIKCINTTTQTYVEELKKQGNFNKSAQKVAMAKTTDAILQVLTDADTELLSTYVDDVSMWIATRVESYMNNIKINNLVNSPNILANVESTMGTTIDNANIITVNEDANDTNNTTEDIKNDGNYTIEEINSKE